MRYKYRGLLMTVTVLALVAQMTLPIFAQQSPTGSIRGIVTDPQGAVIPKAVVTVTNKGTGDVRKVDTGDDGIYLVSTLLPGEYEIKVEAQGFSTQVITTTVEVGKTTPGDAQLRVGAANEIVDVVSEAPVIDKSNYKIDGVISRQKIDSLPLNGRNFLQLALLEPGVSVSVSSPGNANNLFNVSIGGSSAANTRITVDGGSVLDFVTGGAAQNFSTETIQEFQISSFNFDLSTGVTASGAVNIVSRTGTNSYHGSALFFARDDQWAAVPTLGQGAPDFRRYQYGGSIGGPIVKDRAFFFGNVEWLDQDAVFSTVNTGGIPGFPVFTQLNTITGSNYDGVVANIRGDFKINDKNNLFTRYSFDDNDTFGPEAFNTLPSNWRVNTNRDHNIQAGLTTVFTQNFVNDLRFNYQRIKNDSLIPTADDCPPSNPGCIGLQFAQVRVLGSSLRLGNNVNAPQNRILDRYQTSDNVNWQKGAHRIRFGGEWEHNYGKGGWAFLDPALIVLHDPATVAFVNAQVAAAPLPAPLKAALTIPLPAAFINPAIPLTLNDILQLPLAVGLVGLGNPEQPPPFNQETARQSNRYRFYAQDSWQVRQGFTLNFGASYLYETNLFNHDLAKPAILRALIGDLEPSPKDKNNIAPALGFAWDVRNDGKTVIRGGSGLYYDTALFVTRLRERALLNPVGDGRVQLTGAFYRNTIAPIPLPPLPPPLNLINPALGTPLNFTTIPTKFTGQNFLDAIAAQNQVVLAQLQALGAAGITGIEFFKTGTDLLDPGNVSPYTIHYNIGVQRQLPHNMTIQADFVARQSRHTGIVNNDYNLFNRAVARGGPVIRRCSPAEAIDPTVACSNGPISFIQSGNRALYKALLVKLDKRFSNRFQFTGSYALSNLTGYFTGENLENWFEFKGDLGGDARHSFTFSGIVDLPYGFQASLISVLRSKPPFNARVSSNVDLNGDGTFGDTLPGLEINDLNRGTDEDDLRRLVNEFNARFAGTPDAHGTIIPTLTLPSEFFFPDNFQAHDIRLSKTFRIKETYSIQALVEVFNVFNNANIDIDGTTIGSSFGQKTGRVGQSFGTGGPRAIQIGAYFRF